MKKVTPPEAFRRVGEKINPRLDQPTPVWRNKPAPPSQPVQTAYIANVSTKTSTLGVRLAAGTCKMIRQISASRGRTPSDLLAEYAEEVARRHRFCHIEFRDTPLGRMAYVEGTRSAVWLVCDLVEQNKGDTGKTAKLHGWPETKVRAAVNYAEAYPEEIEPLIERARNMTGEAILGVPRAAW